MIDRENNQFLRRPAGAFMLDYGNGEKEVAHTLKCIHGGEIYIARRDMDTGHELYHWCMNCNGYVCYQRKHHPCVRGDGHWENKFEKIESGICGVEIL